MSKSPQCRKCAIELTDREHFRGAGYCYVCAALYGPESGRRRMDEAIREMHAEGSD